MSRSLIVHGLLLSALALGAAPSCSAKKNTEIVVAIQTDLRIPKDINAITIRVLSRGAVQYQSAHEVGPTGVHLPATIGLVPKDDDDLQPIEVQLIGQYGSETDARVRSEKVLRKMRMTFARNRVGLAKIPLKFVCYEHEDCGEGKTCIAGACETTPLLEGDKMPEYGPEAVFGAGGSQGASGACWDAPTCLASAVDIAAAAEPCVYALTGAKVFDAGKVSVAIATGAGGLGYCSGDTCRVPLDLDPAEGWSWTDDTRTKIRLAQGLCAKVTTSKLRVHATDACATKTPELPMCLEATNDAGADASLGDTGPSSDAGEDSTLVDSTIVDSTVVDSTVTMDSGATDGTVDTSVGDTALPDGAPSDTTSGPDAGDADAAADAPSLADMSIEGVPSTMAPGGFAMLTARGSLSGGGTVDLTNSAAWSSLTPTICSVSDTVGSKGRVDAIVPGAGKVRAQYGAFIRDVDISVSSGDAGVDGGGTDSGAPDASPDASPDSGDSCPAGWTSCMGMCTDTNFDPFNCGTCGFACGAGKVCDFASCVICTPITCGMIGAACGFHPDGCGMFMDCGMCTGGMTCDGFNCVP